MTDSTDKVAIVTGASRGIGAACALALGKAGFKVAVHYRSDDKKAQDICDQLPTGKAMPIKLDLAQVGACQELIKRVKEELGSIDVLVNNAGVAIDQILPLAKPDDFQKLLNTNLTPVFLLSKFASKIMIRQKQGRIINISSVVGYTGNAGQSMYAATKSAITGFTKSIAQELAPFGILANCVAPGFIATEMTDALPEDTKKLISEKIPMRRMGTPAEIAAAVAFLASSDASYITGSTLHVNGGMFTN